MRSIADWLIFANFEIFKKPKILVAKRHFQEILPFYPDSTSNLQPFPNF